MPAAAENNPIEYCYAAIYWLRHMPFQASDIHDDVATNYWAYSDVAYAKHAGWLNGYADGSFKGDNAITRAEVVTVVNRATGRKADESYITKNVSILNKFTDIRNNSMWYYADVMEAANTHLANSSNDTETWVK